MLKLDGRTKYFRGVEHEAFMQRCLDLAARGAGNVAPNPMVGAVVVHNGEIVGEGWHEEYGGPHAEVNAIASVQDRAILPECTLYVSLEPCAHTGKTGPCTTLILENKIPKVVIGMQDPFPEVNGKGMENLRAKGVEVSCGILEKECAELNRRFITFHKKKRPYIILKWAVSADNFMGHENERVQLSGPDAQVLLHKWRAEEMGILVGVNTAITDQPQLNVRAWQGRDPQPIILDGNLRADPKKFNAPFIFNYEKSSVENGTRFLRVAAENNILEILQHLFLNNIQSILVEGGADVIQQFIEANAWDEIRVIHSRALKLGQGITAPLIDMTPVEMIELEIDRVKCYQNLIPE